MINRSVCIMIVIPDRSVEKSSTAVYVKRKVDQIKRLMSDPKEMEEYWRHHIRRHIREVLVNIFFPVLIPAAIIIGMFGGAGVAALIEGLLNSGE